MKRTVLFCDRCGKESPHSTIYACVDRRMDAAGSMENVDESVDLCGTCLRVVMGKMVEAMDFAQALQWVGLARQKVAEAKHV